MPYIIDANNLAGKLKMLGDKNFDKKLIELVSNYNPKGGRRIILVFDGQDPMGDKIEYNNLTAIYSPKDDYYKSADDKIVELIETKFGSKFDPAVDEISVITDDIELTKRIKKIEEQSRAIIKIIRATEFVQKLLKGKKDNVEEEDDNRGLSKDEIRKINQDLRRIWGKDNFTKEKEADSNSK